MNIEFAKMHGAGNDFIIIDNTDKALKISSGFVKKICDRKRGIGADGLILLYKVDKNCSFDVEMQFFNCNGTVAEMCGNGLRCAAYYSNKIMNLGNVLKIKTGSGVLGTEVLSDEKVKITIPVVEVFRETTIDNMKVYYGNTGVPHAVVCVDDINTIDIIKDGRSLRNHFLFPEGANVNFVQFSKNKTENDIPVPVRTYERGVEGETLACGTGISASAICLNKFRKVSSPVSFKTVGGDILKVDIPDEENQNCVYLTGPVELICHGEYDLKI